MSGQLMVGSLVLAAEIPNNYEYSLKFLSDIESG